LSVANFSKQIDGKETALYTLCNKVGAELAITNYGAKIVSLMVPDKNGSWIYFDYVPGESNVREGKPDVTGKLCVIGSQLKEDALEALFAAK
jgi:hypothetical protein